MTRGQFFGTVVGLSCLQPLFKKPQVSMREFCDNYWRMRTEKDAAYFDSGTYKCTYNGKTVVLIGGSKNSA